MLIIGLLEGLKLLHIFSHSLILVRNLKCSVETGPPMHVSFICLLIIYVIELSK